MSDSGKPDTQATIVGTGFSTRRNNNDVYFGGYRATVLKARPTSLTVLIPKRLARRQSVNVFVIVKGAVSNAVRFKIR